MISHAIVVPDHDFEQWLKAVRPYAQHFERVAIVRSPAGNNLNLFRDVSAVAAPQTWFQDDPLAHIRRIYPQVVRVDVIRANSPNQLVSILKKRIAQEDRYGMNTGEGKHIYNRFVLNWMTDYRPIEVITPFRKGDGNSKEFPGMDIATRKDSKILAGAAGKVSKIHTGDTANPYGFKKYVQISTTIQNTEYIVTYGDLARVSVRLGQTVKTGKEIGTARGKKSTIYVQSPQVGMKGFRIQNVVDPTMLIYIPGLQVRSTLTEDGLWVRGIPVANDDVNNKIGRIAPYERVDVDETHGRLLNKIGRKDEWIRVRLPTGTKGWSAAWFLRPVTPDETAPVFVGINPVGMNLDTVNRLGIPDPSRLGSIGWVRLVYRVSNPPLDAGSTDIHETYARFRPILEKYVAAGYKVLMVAGHQVYGEGQGDFWDRDRQMWMYPDDPRWSILSERYADMMNRIAAQWAGTGLIHAWQIWNEQDTAYGSVAALSVSPQNYGRLLAKAIPAIKSVDPKVLVITGGHNSGPENGSRYIREAFAHMPQTVRPDGIAFHPYGRGVKPGEMGNSFGHIDVSIDTYHDVMPGKPVWITEWGVLNAQGMDPRPISDYAMDVIRHVKTKYPNTVASLIWYAWSDTMHNGYGIVDSNDNPKPVLAENYLKA